MVLLGFASACRRSELAALDLADVSQVREGLVLRIVRSKTDQSGRGAELGVPRGGRAATCPVRVLQAWLVERGGWPGPLFCSFTAGGGVTRGRLSGDAVALIVKGACVRAGLDPGRYSGHSLRAGCATAASANGAPELAIMARTRHRSVAMLGRYVRHASLFATDPLRGVL